MKNLTIIIFALFFVNSFAQEQVVELEKVEGKNSIRLFCKNNSIYTQEVTLTLKNIKGLSGNKKPIKKRIAPKKKLLFFNLSFKGKYSYSSSISYKRIISKKEKVELEKKEKEELEQKKNKLLLQDFNDINKGIVVFEKTGCGRCSLAISYLLDNNIEFKMLNITKDIKSNNLMLELVRESGHEGRFTTPVILVDGKLSHSHADLGGFLKDLK